MDGWMDRKKIDGWLDKINRWIVESIEKNRSIDLNKWMVGWMGGKKRCIEKNRMAGLTEKEKCAWLVGSGERWMVGWIVKKDGWSDGQDFFYRWVDNMDGGMDRKIRCMIGWKYKMEGWMIRKKQRNGSDGQKRKKNSLMVG